jgi:thiol-disulfide isomerase/thioredoxin
MNDKTSSPNAAHANLLNRASISNNLFVLLGLAVFLFGSSVVYYSHHHAVGESAAVLPSKPIFTFSNPPRAVSDLSIEDANGTVRHLSDFKGKYVLVNIWETHCGGTFYIMPGMNALPTHISRDKLTIVNLSEDPEGTNAVKKFYDKNNYHNLDVYADPTKNARYTLGLRGIPAFVLLNPQGKEVARLEGAADFTKPKNIAWLKSLLK